MSAIAPVVPGPASAPPDGALLAFPGASAGDPQTNRSKGAQERQTTQASPGVNTPDSAKSLAQVVADQNGPSAAPPPPSRAQLEAELATVSAQLSGSTPGAPGVANLEFRATQIRAELAQLTIAPGSYGTRPELRGWSTDKVA